LRNRVGLLRELKLVLDIGGVDS